MKWLHTPLALLGIYNAYKFFDYYVVVWRSLHSQGMGHVYLGIVTFMGSWWLSFALMLCFAGNLFIREGGSWLKVFSNAVLGAGVSFVVPPLMESGFFIAVTWVRDLL